MKIIWSEFQLKKIEAWQQNLNHKTWSGNSSAFTNLRELVEKTLQFHGRTVDACRVGKYVQLEINESTPDKALAKAKEIAEFVLYNPLIETFELEVVK